MNSTNDTETNHHSLHPDSTMTTTPPRNMILVPTSSAVRSSTTPITSNRHHPQRNGTSTNTNNNSGTTSPIISSNPHRHAQPPHHSHPSHHANQNSVMTSITTTSISTNTSNNTSTTNKRLYRTAVTSITKTNNSTNNSDLKTTSSTTSSTPPSNQSNIYSAPTAATTNTSTTTTTTTTTKWVTRDIASLEFLLNIPLAAEREIVTTGYQLQIQRELDYYHSNHPSSASSSSSSSSSPLKKEVEGDGDNASTNHKKVSFQNYIPTTNSHQNQIPSSAKGTWWEKWIASTTQNNDGLLSNKTKKNSNNNNNNDADELEQPTAADRKPIKATTATMAATSASTTTTTIKAIPGRRLDGDMAVRIQIPVTTITTIASNRKGNSNNNNNITSSSTNNTNINNSKTTTTTMSTLLTKQTSIARQAALREWEITTAFGTTRTTQSYPTNSNTNTNNTGQPPMLDGRLFFSANSSYPISVFSILRYEPRKEEAAFRRRKLEAIGGGGSQFVLPNRDWRGISYRALLRRSGDDKKTTKKFNRFVRSDSNDTDDKNDDNVGSSHKTKRENDDDSSTSSDSSSSSEDSYTPGLLDDPGMVLGRHRNVMIGDRVTGPIVSSTIQFVKPAVLKAELNKQFRERFDGWEPPKSARKYIGAKVIQGNYVLIDPTEEYDEQSYVGRRPRQGSVNSMSNNSDGGAKEYTIRMPPSLTLSKIRSVKRQALNAAVKANLEIGTVALACVYFERLCLDCRVDKSNRRVTFAACLLLAAKLNEPNVVLVMEREKKQHGSANKTSSSHDEKQTRFQSMIRPNKRSNNMFESLLLFFTQDWNLSLKHLFTVEWGVFAALNFSLDATPSQIAFHFKRLMKTLEWNALNYLGSIMYNQWQDALADEEERRLKRERRRDASRKNNEDRIRSFRFQFRNEQSRDTATAVDTDSENEHLHNPSNTIDDKRRKNATNTIVDTAVTGSPKDIPPKSPAKPKATTINAATEHANRRIKLFNRFNLGRSASTEHLEGTTTATSIKSNARASVTAKATENETILPLHTSPSMPNFMRSVSSLLPRDDTIPKSNDGSRNGMVAIEIPDFIELDGPPMTADIENGRLVDHPSNDTGVRTKQKEKKNDIRSDDDEGIIV